MSTVEFRNVSKQFANGTVALRDFSLKINDGELVVLVGPSGCGKSTILRLLAGLEDVTAGDILIDEKIVNQIIPQQRNIAMVFQNYALYPHMNVRSNLEFPLKMLHTAKESMAQIISDIADILNLQDLLDRKPAQLSGGQKQRVAMGRALVRNPSVFLLDEPLSNLDAKLRAQIRADISELQKRLQKTTLYVTHDQVEAMTLGDRVAVIDSGELHQIGKPTELYQSPQSIFVARFIGSPGMNIIASRLQKGSNNQWVAKAGKLVDIPLSKKPAKHFLQEGEFVYAGIRPESISTQPAEKCLRLRANCVTTEFLGHETLVYFYLPGIERKTPLIARLPGQFHPNGKTTDLFITPETVYLFHRNGTAIL
ncbi:MAG: sn-glycerol-3-phosphate ABC transporter ATP-binding protein UgpC [Desulfobulbaceae bacterium]|nr:sn-glycerol-3-phosphate ABC transporter ATP-binding protein UgpC [Desulfobulbaceae bacterium]